MKEETSDEGIAVARISLDALSHNAKELKERVTPSKLLAVVKADAYGHGAVACATQLSKLESVSGLAVARVTEGVELRRAGIASKILVLNGVTSENQLLHAYQNNLELIVHNKKQVDWLADFSKNNIVSSRKPIKKLKIWIKVDTGMSRLGFNLEEVALISDSLLEIEIVSPNISYLSHLACADELNHPLTYKQITLFDELFKQGAQYTLKESHKKQIENDFSLAASAGVLMYPETHYQWVRPGIALYGISPFEQHSGSDFNLKPVMSLVTRLISIKEVKSGCSVGYGAKWIASKDSIIGIVAIGYGDGYPRSTPTGTPVWINGYELPIIGRVCMDSLTVDLTEYYWKDRKENDHRTEQNRTLDCRVNFEIGDLVELWGEHISVERVAKALNTIPYELLTRLTRRVEYQWK